MAFTEFTCRSGGNNLYAGTLNGSAEASTTPLVTYASGSWVQSTRVFTVASGNPVTDGVTVGMFASVYPDGTSGSAVYIGRISGVTSTTITISTAVSGTAPTDGTSNRTLVVGGAWQGPNGTSGFPFGFVNRQMTDASSNPLRVNFKNDQTYSITANIANAAASNGKIIFQGYTSTFGDGGKAAIDGGTSGAAYVLLTIGQFSLFFADLIFRNNGSTSNANLVTVSAHGQIFYRCVFHGGRGNGVGTTTNAMNFYIQCEAYDNNKSNTANQGGFSTGCPSLYENCISHDNTGTNSSGFVNVGLNNGVVYVGCIADSNGQYGFWSQGTQYSALIDCVAYNNGSDGLRLLSADQSGYSSNSIFYGNTGYGINRLGGQGSCFVTGVAWGNNTSGNSLGVADPDPTGTVSLSGDPFVDAANGDFDLNNTSGAGAACRGTGIGTFTQTQAGYSGTLSYPDIGASQHQDTGGGGALLTPRTQQGGYNA